VKGEGETDGMSGMEGRGGREGQRKGGEREPCGVTVIFTVVIIIDAIMNVRIGSARHPKGAQFARALALWDFATSSAGFTFHHPPLFQHPHDSDYSSRSKGERRVST
jgi:hypothetical protein